MDQFRVNGKKATIQIEVIKAGDNGDETKVLAFSCAASNSDFIKAVHAVAKKVDADITAGNAFEKLEEIEAELKKGFDVAAPGSWDEFYDFLDRDIVNMANLWRLLVEKITAAATETKIAAATPAIPEDGATV